MRFIGDVHGHNDLYFEIASGVKETIQVGDLGVGFPGNAKRDERVAAFQQQGQHRFIRGNHDSPSVCRAMPGWIPDGTYDGRGLFFVGGAWSIDHRYRVLGETLWEDEELSVSQFLPVIDYYVAMRPRVVVTHDCPHSVAKTMFLLDSKPQYRTKTSSGLEAMLEAHKPELWVFGHWHETKELQVGPTTFQCLGELEYLDLDL